jgi:nucleotidyltransferase substrate binding protein (TIGR01987 family)
MSDDLRWRQRLGNYQRALSRLRSALDLAAQRPLSELEQQGLIQAFEFTHELAWKVMKDYLVYQGRNDLTGSRDATRAAFAAGLIADGDGWMEMIASRLQSNDSFDDAVAEALATRIKSHHGPLLEVLEKRMVVQASTQAA